MTLQLAEAYERDFSRYTDNDGRRQRLTWLQGSPVAKQWTGGAFRLDVSCLGNNDMVVSDEQSALERHLVEILGTRGTPTAKAYSDIDHLLAHHMSGADAFITVDQSTILKHLDALAAHGITVLTAAEAVLGAGHRPPKPCEQSGPDV